MLVVLGPEGNSIIIDTFRYVPLNTFSLRGAEIEPTTLPSYPYSYLDVFKAY
jgi:hypothetical protein